MNTDKELEQMTYGELLSKADMIVNNTETHKLSRLAFWHRLQEACPVLYEVIQWLPLALGIAALLKGILY